MATICYRFNIALAWFTYYLLERSNQLLMVLMYGGTWEIMLPPVRMKNSAVQLSRCDESTNDFQFIICWESIFHKLHLQTDFGDVDQYAWTVHSIPQRYLNPCSQTSKYDRCLPPFRIIGPWQLVCQSTLGEVPAPFALSTEIPEIATKISK